MRNKRPVSVREARKVMAHRSPTARAIYGRIRARRAFKVGSRKSYLWRRNPAEFDLFGIDRPSVRKRREVKRVARILSKSFHKGKAVNRKRLTGVELLALRQDYVRRTRQAPDTLDLRALVDSSLSYRENRENLRRHTGLTRAAEDIARDYVGFDFGGYAKSQRGR